MKFKFCSDGDCPLWVLAGLHAISSLSVQLFKKLLHLILEDQPDDGIQEILENTKLSTREESARAAAVLRWTIKQAHRCGCSSVQLVRDLLVLGVPRAHATAIAEAADSSRDTYIQNAQEHGFMVNKLTDIKATPAPEGTVDVVKLTLYSDNGFTGEQNSTDLLIDKSLLKTLISELKVARNKVEEIHVGGD